RCCRTSLSLSAPVLDLQCRFALDPVADGVLDQFLQLDLGLADARDHSEVLSRVVAYARLVDEVLGLQQRIGAVPVLEMADHADRIERVALECLAPAVEVGLEAA